MGNVGFTTNFGVKHDYFEKLKSFKLVGANSLMDRTPTLHLGHPEFNPVPLSFPHFILSNYYHNIGKNSQK